jgi:hypothetical protein
MALSLAAARADMPARDIEYADTQALRAVVLEYFGPCQTDQLMATLDSSEARPCPTRGVVPGQRCLGDGHTLHRALARLITESGKAKRDGVDEFLARVNDGDILRGHLIARSGGDYAIRLRLDTEKGERFLVYRHLFKDGHVAEWRFPLAAPR